MDEIVASEIIIRRPANAATVMPVTGGRFHAIAGDATEDLAGDELGACLGCGFAGFLPYVRGLDRLGGGDDADA